MTDPTPDDAKSRGSRLLLGTFAVFLALLFVVAGLHSWRDLDISRSRSRQLEERIHATEQSIETLERGIERLQHDPRDLERAAREELGLVYPDEVVIVLPEEEDP